MQLFKLLANPAFRKSVQRLREDLANAGVNVDPEVWSHLHFSCYLILKHVLERNGDVERFQGPTYKVEIILILVGKSNTGSDSVPNNSIHQVM